MSVSVWYHFFLFEPLTQRKLPIFSHCEHIRRLLIFSHVKQWRILSQNFDFIFKSRRFFLHGGAYRMRWFSIVLQNSVFSCNWLSLCPDSRLKSKRLKPIRISKVCLQQNSKMHLCSHNLRIGIYSGTALTRIENNTLLGPVGEIYNRAIFSKIYR